MIMNLFSVFDPTSYFGFTLNWLIIIMVFLFIPSRYFFIKRDYMNLYILIFNIIKKMFNEVAEPNHRVISFICVITFLFVMVRNLLGLFPFVFTRTAHPIITIGFGLVIWISFFLIGWLKNFKNSAAHLVPEGRPLILSPLLVLIERVSHLIRPFTLSIRLAANIIAGHLIIGLLARIRNIRMFGFFRSVFFQSVLLVLEFGVSVIQGFVFSILILLYALDYY